MNALEAIFQLLDLQLKKRGGIGLAASAAAEQPAEYAAHNFTANG